MISLFIDTSLSFIRIVILRDDKIIDSINEFCDKDLSRLFDIKIKNLFDKNSLNFRDIKKIYCVTGPGSFTGIRVGMTFAKVLAWSLKIDIIPISELQVLASIKYDTDYIAPMIDARRGFVYAGLYDNNLDVVDSDKHILLDDFLAKYEHKNITYVSYNQFDNINIIKPNINFMKIINKNSTNSGINPHVLVPNYLKNTEAEEKLKEKLKNDNNI